MIYLIIQIILFKINNINYSFVYFSLNLGYSFRLCPPLYLFDYTDYILNGINSKIFFITTEYVCGDSSKIKLEDLFKLGFKCDKIKVIPNIADFSDLDLKYCSKINTFITDYLVIDFSYSKVEVGQLYDGNKPLSIPSGRWMGQIS